MVFLIIYVNPYTIGVSNAAKKTLNKKPFTNSIENLSHAITSNVHNKNKTENVSTNCEKTVDALLRSHKCFPFVKFFQK